MRLALGLLLASISAWGTTYNAATCNRSDVVTALGSASSQDMVTVPSGSCSWASDISITLAIHFQGAGSGSTIITGGGVDYSPTSGEASKTFEMDGFGFTGTGRKFEAFAPSSSVAITGLKIHDNVFNNATERAIALSGMEFGVFYGNSFDDNYISISVIGASDNGWDYTYSFGSQYCPYFEDNIFGNGTGAFVFETGQGGRICFRHNTITGYACSGCEVFDTHGDQGDRGTVLSEIIHNDVGVGASGTYRWMHHRGGRAIIANNVVSRAIGYNFTEYKAWGGNGTCGSYPASDQINNTFYFGNTANGSAADPPTFTNLDDPGSCMTGGESAFLQEGRDYWLPDSGTAASRPGTCTMGDYYGATDTDVISYCSATNTWSTYYTPYTYPHPLVGGGDSTPPVRSAGSPSGTVAYGATKTLSLTTDETATCKWDTDASTAYASMSDTFSSTGSTSHSTTASVSVGANTFYVRCTDGTNANTDDYTITFTVQSESPTVTRGIGGGQTLPGGSTN